MATQPPAAGNQGQWGALGQMLLKLFGGGGAAQGQQPAAPMTTQPWNDPSLMPPMPNPTPNPNANAQPMPNPSPGAATDPVMQQIQELMKKRRAAQLLGQVPAQGLQSAPLGTLR